MGAGEQPRIPSNTPDLQPPGSLPQPQPGAVSGYRWVWTALAVMLVLGLGVVFLLPQLVSEGAPESPSAGPAAPPSPAQSPAVNDRAAARREAEQGLQTFLHLRAELELSHAPAWGEPAWSQSGEAAAGGDRLFGERRFGDAAQRYAAAVQLLEDLRAGKRQRLTAALDAGYQALQGDDGEAAGAQFELALLIEPGHVQAQQGLARARVRAQVLQHMQEGAQAEAGEDLEAARHAYSLALQLDGEYAPASEAEQRVSQQLIDIGFRQAMSSALTALQANRFKDAGTALDQAARLKPDDTAVHDARQRLAGARRQARLNALRRKASDSARAEDWASAVSYYQQAISVDGNAGFAREGLAHAQERLRLHRQFDHYLADATRVYSSQPLANAEQLLSFTGQAAEVEPRLAEKIVALQQQVSQARIPLQVTLTSDGETEVVIHHVGRLGRFLDQQLELRPGTYTVVGSRPGYRDVRKVLTVQPGASPPQLEIRCEEAI